jgi:hypothetical protein
MSCYQAFRHHLTAFILTDVLRFPEQAGVMADAVGEGMDDR